MTIQQAIIEQNHHDLIPFLIRIDNGFSNDGSQIKFILSTERDSYLNYDEIVSPSAQTETTNKAYVPDNANGYYMHEPQFYVDMLIPSSPSGIRNNSARADNEKYQDESVTYRFKTPKFSWSNKTQLANASSSVVTTNMDNATGSVWLGTENKTLHQFQYNANAVSEAYSLTLDSKIEDITFDPLSSVCLITTYDNIYKYLLDHYLNQSGDYVLTLAQDYVLYNDSNEKIVLIDNDTVWSVQSYEGKITQRNKDDLAPIQEIEGFDAPFKIIKSSFHDCYFVAGTSILWQVQGTTKTAIYSMSGYNIADFTESKNGEVCLALNGTDDSFVRILDRNFFRILYNYRTTETVLKCSFADPYIYAVSENKISDSSIATTHHTFNTLNGQSSVYETTNTITEQDESSSENIAVDVIELDYPNGGETLLLGETVEIKWRSSESVTDKVKITLLKGGQIFSTITSSTDNTGIYGWKVPDTLPISPDYRIRVTWITTPEDIANSDISSAVFSISDTIPSSSEEIIPLASIVDVGHDSVNNQIVLVLREGHIGFFDLSNQLFNGWFSTTIEDINCASVKNERRKIFNTVSKVRIFVGTQPNLNNMWDSGVIEAHMTSMYYGGGDNLVSGETYYVNIQVYSSNTGWSEVQTQSFKMP